MVVCLMMQIDPVSYGPVLAVTRLQTLVSREVSPTKMQAVITVGEFHAGKAENIIPDGSLF